MREEKRKQRELQEIEKKQAMEKIMALKKTTVGARALKNLTEQVIKRKRYGCWVLLFFFSNNFVFIRTLYRCLCWFSAILLFLHLVVKLFCQ